MSIDKHPDLCYNTDRKKRKGNKTMKHLQKPKEVTVVVWYARNGHFKDSQVFGNALQAKRYAENLAKESPTPLYFRIHDKWNDLYCGDGKKI